MTLICFLLLYTVSSVYVFLTPFTKVEESFNIQAIHDFIYYKSYCGSSRLTLYNSSDENCQFRWDHQDFPGPVPRTFLGAFVLSLFSFKIFSDKLIVQCIARLSLSMLFSFAYYRFTKVISRKYDSLTGNFLVLTTCTQFHVLFYASRTLPNTYAFILVLFALSEWISKNYNLFITIVAVTVVIFRFETCLLFGPIILHSIFIQKDLTISKLLKIGIPAGLASLILTISFDSIFWEKWLYPEGSSLYFNIYLNKSKDWGTSPFMWYFYSALPRALLLNIFSIPFASKKFLKNFLSIAIIFVFTYSFLPHKELRFIIYSLPLFNVCSANTLAYLWQTLCRKSKREISQKAKSKSRVKQVTKKDEVCLNEKKNFRFNSNFLVRSLIFSIMIANSSFSFYATLISSLNYPGGNAVRWINSEIQSDDFDHHLIKSQNIGVYVTNLAAQTGFTRFLQLDNIFYEKSKNISSLINMKGATKGEFIHFKLLYLILEEAEVDYFTTICRQSENTANDRFTCTLNDDSMNCDYVNEISSYSSTKLNRDLRNIIQTKPVLWIFKCKSS